MCLPVIQIEQKKTLCKLIESLHFAKYQKKNTYWALNVLNLRVIRVHCMPIITKFIEYRYGRTSTYTSFMINYIIKQNINKQILLVLVYVCVCVCLFALTTNSTTIY